MSGQLLVHDWSRSPVLCCTLYKSVYRTRIVSSSQLCQIAIRQETDSSGPTVYSSRAALTTSAAMAADRLDTGQGVFVENKVEGLVTVSLRHVAASSGIART